MIIYNKTWLNNLQVHELVNDEENGGYITRAESKAVKQKYPVGFYSPGIFIRIGLVILTCVITLCVIGLLSLMVESSWVLDSFGWPLFWGIVTYIILEIMARNNNYHGSGVDDALLWLSAGSIFGAIIWATDAIGAHSFITSICVLILSAYFTLRFADVLMGAVTCLSFLAVVYFGWQLTGSFGVATLPFMMMLASGVLFVIARRTVNKTYSAYYKNCLIAAQALGLLALYAAGNYYIVSELSKQLSGTTYSIEKPVPFGFFFWCWTMLMPLAYLIAGIKTKNTILLRAGLLLIAAGIATFRYYYHIIPTGIALTLGGVILLSLMYAAVKYLKKPKHGITYANANKNGLLDDLKIESLLAAGAFSHAAPAPAKPVGRFGGGSFGGGGASDSF